MSAPPVFTRVVLGLDQGGFDRAILRFAADFARLLQLNLHGVFAQDPGLAHLVTLPALREFRLLERQWRPVEGRSLSADMEVAAAVARQSFDEIARGLGVARDFEVVRARSMEAIASVSGESDIVIVAERRATADLARESLADTVAAALATPAAVLVVPNPIVRQRGPIVAIGETGEDVCVAIAAAIAAAADERVEVTVAGDRDVSLPRPRPGPHGERLIVMTRHVSTRLSPLSVVARRRVPVLVLGRGTIGPDAAGAGTKTQAKRQV